MTIPPEIPWAFFRSLMNTADEIVLGGTFRNVIIFQFKYLGDFTPQGDETCTLRFYANDGESELGPDLSPPTPYSTRVKRSQAGLVFRGPPTVGIKPDDIWRERRDSKLFFAARFNGSPAAKFFARIICRHSITFIDSAILPEGETKYYRSLSRTFGDNEF
ncbi:MAG: hypothetical protein M2R45_05443 [Verrucomicrobia subdivision 3 bacterium]|nr:hypothetical protein [Limisphaerales bacterium]MCS1417791.1 hypothetical protein [Limisphaerales bacterium]